MDRNEVTAQFEKSLGRVEPHPMDHEMIVARVGRRRHRRRIGAIGAGLGLLAVVAVAIAIGGGPLGGPLGPPIVEASAKVMLPGEVIGAHGQVVDTAAAEGDHLWVLTCAKRCGGPPANFEHSRGALVEIDSGSGAIIAKTPVEGASIVAAGDGGVWTAGFDGRVTPPPDARRSRPRLRGRPGEGHGHRPRRPPIGRRGAGGGLRRMHLGPRGQ